MSWLAGIHRRLVAGHFNNPLRLILLLLLLPPALIFGVLGWARSLCYAAGIFSSYRSSLKVVSVGNLAVGGLGKTPAVDWLVKEFASQGKRVAIISRGYGGKFSGAAGIVSNGREILMDADEAGDEPLLLARRNPHCPVLIARKRVNAIKVIESQYDVDLIILDDGFQHQAVNRDIDLVLLDGARPFGNGWPLPAGNLREFPVALKRADILLMTRSDRADARTITRIPAFTSRHSLSDEALSLDNVSMTIEQLSTMKLLAFAGIANPDDFFISLERLGLFLCKKVSFPDHVRYSAKEISLLAQEATDVDAFVTTEKDAVKLSADMLKLPCYQVPLTLEIDNASVFFEQLNKQLWSQ